MHRFEVSHSTDGTLLMPTRRHTLRAQERLSFTRPVFINPVFVSRRRAHCFDASLHLGRSLLTPPHLIKRQPVAITPLRIRGTLVDESVERGPRVLVLPGL